ncbi:MAG: hypothetical protein CTY12_03975 [Methylotenera sp.]|jgi:site-specific recombinase XerD|nr:MAG: hypothetical protein CTY12_03975 [Methylotenera sp.]
MKHRVITKEAGSIPMISWPDGSWCLQANVYMLDLYYRGLSRKNKGGTLLTYAANISHLLRYIFNNKFDLAKLTDNQFSLFIKTLQAEKRGGDQPSVSVRDSNSVIAIGRNCLDFLATVGRLYQDENFVSPNGQIRAEQKEFSLKQDSSRRSQGKLIRKFWHHRAFPSPSPKHKRLPISTVNVEKLRQIIQTESNTHFQRKRRYVMLKLLEITGGRRSEVAALTCNSVYQASKTNMLEILTAKRSGGREEFRFIPIASHDVAFLIEFIEKNRRSVIRSTCGNKNDDGCLLISQTSGLGLRANTITQEIATLSQAAGITEKSCPHMFRHRFITKLFVALIEQHKFENVDSFRRALLDTERIKQIVQQWTGHSNLESLDIYIHLAFDEIANFKDTYNIVNTKRVVQSFKGTLNQIQIELKNGGQLIEISERLNKLVEEFQEDLDRT